MSDELREKLEAQFPEAVRALYEALDEWRLDQNLEPTLAGFVVLVATPRLLEEWMPGFEAAHQALMRKYFAS